MHAGDLDYESAPRMRLFVDETVRGQGMDSVAAKGNHDADGWGRRKRVVDPDDGYAAQLLRPTQPGNCYGAYGESLVCDYGAVTLVISSVGVDAAGESANQREVAFLERALSQSASRFKVCVWHMNQENMQVSYKGDSTGWGAFEICRKHGAFIVNGHAHTYSRTKEMVRFGERRWSHTAEDLRVADAVLAGAQDENVVRLRSGENGSTAVAVVGFGGYTRRSSRARRTGRRCTRRSALDGDGAQCETALEQKNVRSVDVRLSRRREPGRVFRWSRRRARRRRAARNARRTATRWTGSSWWRARRRTKHARRRQISPTTTTGGRCPSRPTSQEGGRGPTPASLRRRSRPLDLRGRAASRPLVRAPKAMGQVRLFMKSNGLCDRTGSSRSKPPRAKREDYEDDYVEQPRAAEEEPADAPAPAVADAIDFDSIAADVLRLRQDEENAERVRDVRVFLAGAETTVYEYKDKRLRET